MLISAEILQHLCPTYQAAVKNLEDAINSTILDCYAKEKYFENFVDKFTAIPQIWFEWERLIEDFPLEDDEKEQKMERMYREATYHFYHSSYTFDDVLPRHLGHNKYWTKFIESRQLGHHEYNLREELDSMQTTKELLMHPNSRLENFRKDFNQYSSRPITESLEKKYQNSRMQYEKIMSVAKDDDEKWLECLKEVKNDDKFIVQNIEYKLGKNPGSRKIWQLYIEILRERKLFKWLLDKYSRYCRFFVDDLEIKDEYILAVEECQNLFDLQKWQIDIAKLELHFGSEATAYDLFTKYFGKVETQFFLNKMNEKSEKLLLMPDYAKIDENPCSPLDSKIQRIPLTSTQKMSLPIPLIFQILENSNFLTLQKLYSASKQLHSIFKVAICHRFKTMVDQTFIAYPFEQSIFVSKNFDNKKLPKLYLTNALHLHCSQFPLSKFISKIYKCEIRFLKLVYQKLQLKEFDILKSCVENMEYVLTTIMDDENGVVSVKELLDRMPNIVEAQFNLGRSNYFVRKNHNFSAQENPTKLKKIRKFRLYGAENPIQSDAVAHFIIKNADRSVDSYFSFRIEEEEIPKCLKILKNKISKWEPHEKWPIVYLHP